MAHLYIDENVAHAIGHLLAQSGHDVEFARKVGNKNFTDDRHLLHATLQDRIVVTHNFRDFRLLHDCLIAWSRQWRFSAPHAGILVLAQIADDDRLARMVDTFLHPSRQVVNELYYWTPGDSWRRRVAWTWEAVT